MPFFTCNQHFNRCVNKEFRSLKALPGTSTRVVGGSQNEREITLLILIVVLHI